MKPIVNALKVAKAEGDLKAMYHNLFMDTVDHLMAGIEGIANIHGHNWLRSKFQDINVKYINKLLIEEPPFRNMRLVESYQRLSYATALNSVKKANHSPHATQLHLDKMPGAKSVPSFASLAAFFHLNKAHQNGLSQKPTLSQFFHRHNQQAFAPDLHENSGLPKEPHLSNRDSYVSLDGLDDAAIEMKPEKRELGQRKIAFKLGMDHEDESGTPAEISAIKLPVSTTKSALRLSRPRSRSPTSPRSHVQFPSVRDDQCKSLEEPSTKQLPSLHKGDSNRSRPRKKKSHELRASTSPASTPDCVASTLDFTQMPHRKLASSLPPLAPSSPPGSPSASSNKIVASDDAERVAALKDKSSKDGDRFFVNKTFEEDEADEEASAKQRPSESLPTGEKAAFANQSFVHDESEQEGKDPKTSLSHARDKPEREDDETTSV